MQDLQKNLDFFLYDVFKLEQLFARPRFHEHNREVIDAVLATARDIAEDKLAPHNAKGDANEPQFDGETVELIPETKEAWDAIAQAGFIAASHDYSWGGIQLPELVARAAICFFNVANIATSGYPFLTVGASNLIVAFADDRYKRRFLPPMLEGRFSGTMALTESAQGSSLADITTTATPQADGTFKLKGQKIYISGGDHGLTENIVHMVLAKIPGAPEGVKGISLFICPKFLVNDDGSIGADNDVALAGLLHKMGYRNTTSTVLSFGEKDNCIAYLVGKPHHGLVYMFQMMNEARIGVGLGAACLGYAGYSYSLDYARERKQGRLASNKNPLSEQVSIIEHADVRRMLLAQKSYVEGSIALCLFTSRLVDDEKTAPSDSEKQKAHKLLDFLTPIVKSWPSKYGLKANEIAIQVLGGSGYIREYPVEQYYRDNRLNAIHEGTEGIQGIDLLGRKTTTANGELYQAFLEAVTETIQTHKNSSLAKWAGQLEHALEMHKETTLSIHAAMPEDIDLALANATEYLDYTGRIVLAWIWLKLATVAQEKLQDSSSDLDEHFYQGKLEAARYHFEWELPQTEVQATLLKTLNRTPFDMKDEWY